MFFPILHDFPGDKRFSKTKLKRQRKIKSRSCQMDSVLLVVRWKSCSSNASDFCSLPGVQWDTATHLWEKSSLKTSFNLPMTSFSQSGTKLPYFFITSSRNPLNTPEKLKCKHIKSFWVHQSNKALSSYRYKQQSLCTQPTCSTTHGKYLFKKTKLKFAT